MFKKFITKKKIIGYIISICIAIIIPIIINECYKKNEGYMTLWGAKEVFAFYGNLLGAVATIYAVYLTIAYNTFKHSYEIKMRSRPYIDSSYSPENSFEVFCQEGKNIFFIEINVNERNSVSVIASQEIDQIKDLQIKNINIGVNNLNIENFDEIKNDMDRELNFFRNNYTFIYKVRNAGSGNAINSKFFIDNKLVKPPFAITCNEEIEFKIRVYINNILCDIDYYDLQIEFNYLDQNAIFNYSQKEEIRIFRDENGNLSSSQDFSQCITEPKEVNNINSKS